MFAFNIVCLFCFYKKKEASLPLLNFVRLHESSMVPMVVWLNKSSVKPEVALGTFTPKCVDTSMCYKKISCIKLHLFKIKSLSLILNILVLSGIITIYNNILVLSGKLSNNVFFSK